MDLSHRELLVARIISGTVRLRLSDERGGTHVFLYSRPTRAQSYLAEEIYHDQLACARNQDILDEDGLMDYLIAEGQWTEAEEKLLTGLPKEIEQFKVGLFQAQFRSYEREVIRKALATARSRLNELQQKRHVFDRQTCTGLAIGARSRALVAFGLRTLSGDPLYSDEVAYWASSDGLVEEALEALDALRIEETAYRELARTSPWQDYWACRKSDTLFGVAATDYSEEQRALVSFSTLYDNVREHPECPSDAILEDDDMLDGWLILQRREREKRTNTVSGEASMGSDAIRRHDEVYLVANSKEDAERIMSLNDSHTRSVQRQRFKTIAEKGIVQEAEMPDTKAKLRMEVTQKMREAMRAR